MAEAIRFQHFEVQRKDDGSLFELGRGAMGITYKAFDTNLRCDVALKVINAAYLNSEIARQRFLREARAAAALRHQNVASVFHLGSEDDNYFYAMEFVDGETVEGFMKREGAVPTLVALEIAIQVSRALGAAQKQGLVHRDIKPSNLMIVREEGGDFTVKVIDFGLAKNIGGEGEDAATLTAGGFLGTPHFASPEQLEEREIDVRSDIYSLGVTLWYMLAGKTPFSGSLAQVMSQHLHREPPFENLEGQPPEVVTLLRHMMAKAPEDRPQTPLELRREIEKCEAMVRDRPMTSSGLFAGDDNFETTVLPPPVGSEAVDLSSGTILAQRFRLVSETTASDHGRMFRAESLEDGSTVAILILHSGILSSSEAFTRMEQEVEKLQQLKHPVFQRILSLEHANHHTFLALEWIEGPSLLDTLRSRRAFSAAEAKTMLVPLADAFDELHAAGLSCPDIAAHEVLIPGGTLSQPKFLPLTTSGAASLSPEATMVASSFALMKAHGAFTGNPATAYVFAVASLGYEMLGGVRTGSSMGSYVPIPGLSEEGNAALRRAMNPAQAYPTAKAFVDDLPASGSISIAPQVPAPQRTSVPPAPVKPATAPSSPAMAPPPLPTPTVAPLTSAIPPVPPETKPKRSLLPILGGIFAVLILIGALAVWQGIRLLERIKAATPIVHTDEPTPDPTGTPEATPQATPIAAATPTATPTPAIDPQKTAYEEALSEAQDLQHQDNYAGAIAAYAAIASRFPGEKRPFDMMEMLAANLRSRLAKLTPSELAGLRQPLELAAGHNVVSAQMMLGETLRQSDPSDALKWLIAAGNQNQTEAMVLAGKMLADSRNLGTADLPGAVVWFRKAASMGDSEGMFALGECLLFGKGTDKNPQEAIEVLTSAAALGNARAMNLLANEVYRRGINGLVPPNPQEALRLFSQSSQLGYLDAQGNLGVLYINGEGVSADEKKALDLFKDGAEKENPSCMFYYAMCLEGGKGTTRDPVLARTYFVKAAKGGDRRAVEWCKKNNIPLANAP